MEEGSGKREEGGGEEGSHGDSDMDERVEAMAEERRSHLCRLGYRMVAVSWAEGYRGRVT